MRSCLVNGKRPYGEDGLTDSSCTSYPDSKLAVIFYAEAAL